MRESKMTDYLPINPCEGCKIFEGVNEICQPRDGAHCSNYSEYKASLAALEKYVDWWLEFMKGLQATPETITILSQFESMLVKIREAKG
jgi:hypothetical protein